MSYLPFLTDRTEVNAAAELMRHYGEHAGFEAALRADASAECGNTLHFCRWRQIERLIVLLSVDRAIGTIH